MARGLIYALEERAVIQRLQDTECYEYLNSRIREILIEPFAILVRIRWLFGVAQQQCG